MSRELRILVAEDNRVNRTLIVGILGRRNDEVTVVEDGEAAVRARTRDDFDVVLMEVRMPVVDGLEATRRIRALEAERDLVRSHIVALTTEVASGDRARCLEAGMDDCLAGPLRAPELLDVLDRCASEAARTIAAPLPTLETLLDAVGGDPNLLGSIIQVWTEERDAMLGAVRDAVEKEDPKALRAAAHKLKGAVAAFRFDAFVGSARELEERGSRGSTADVSGMLAELEAHAGELDRHLARVRERLGG